MEVLLLNPRVLQVVDCWQLQKSYESLMVVLSSKKDAFYAREPVLPKDSQDCFEEIPAVAVINFMNNFLKGRLSVGVNANTMQPAVFLDHRQILDMSIIFPQDVFTICLEDDVIQGSFGEEQSKLLRKNLQLQENFSEVCPR